jgi:hypothetical protein
MEIRVNTGQPREYNVDFPLEKLFQSLRDT